MRKIAIITGTRADYGRLVPVIKAIKDNENLEPLIIATGMHLSHEFGYTIDEIEKDGFEIAAKVDMKLKTNGNADMVKSLGIAVVGLAEVMEDMKPDIILVLGDRGEALAGAMVGAHMNILVAHIHGGEVTGSIDESIRHAITKFAHIHFSATEGSKERIIKLGEVQEYIFNVGAPGLDSILNRKYLSKNEITKKLGLKSDKKIILVAQHPVTSEKNISGYQMEQTLKAIKNLDEQIVIIYPNSDAGSSEIITLIERCNHQDNIKTFKNIPFEDYLNLLNCSDVMIGNSSSAIMEAPSFGLPAVNIGTRQNGRERATNIIDVDYDEDEIYNATVKALYEKEFIDKVKKCVNPYGDGKSGIKIAKILSEIDITMDLLQKKITY